MLDFFTHLCFDNTRMEDNIFVNGVFYYLIIFLCSFGFRYYKITKHNKRMSRIGEEHSMMRYDTEVLFSNMTYSVIILAILYILSELVPIFAR
jgi:hypothetical protein